MLHPSSSLRRPLSIAAAIVPVALLALVAPEGVGMLSPAIVLALLLWQWPVVTERPIRWVRRILRRRRNRADGPLIAAPARPTPTIPAGLRRSFALASRPPPTAA